MDIECNYCHALKFKNETAAMCCSAGKIRLPPFLEPPEPLRSLLLGVTSDSKLFLKKTRKFNSCFQVTSFSANIVTDVHTDGRRFESTFKIQGQIYHQIDSLYHLPNEDPKFLQIYFLGDEDEQTNIRCRYHPIERIQERAIVANLETFLKDTNQLIRLFKHASDA